MEGQETFRTEHQKLPAESRKDSEQRMAAIQLRLVKNGEDT